jgi:hypothetical protein
MEIEA